MRPVPAMVVAVLFLLGACKSADQKLANYLKEARYAEARALLEEEKVGATLSPKADARALTLRERFTADIETSTASLVDSLIAKRSTRDAQKTALERKEFCPWSAPLVALVERCDGLVARIVQAEQKWTPVFADDVVAVYQARRFLSELAPDRPWILDSEALRRCEERAFQSIVAEWSGIVSKRQGRLQQADHDALHRELLSIGIQSTELEELDSVLNLVQALPTVQANGEVHLNDDAVKALVKARSLLGNDGMYETKSRLLPCISAAWSAFARWHREDFPRILDSLQVTYAELAVGEAWNSVASYGQTSRASLARAHVHVAARLAPQGIASVLALIHLGRAKEHGLPAADEQLVAVERLALATRAVSPAPVYRLRIDLEPKVDPQVHDLVERAFQIGLQSDVKALGRLDLFEQGRELPHVTVTIRDAELIADFSNLQTIASSYFSHFENVPNLAKSLLKSQLDSAKWDVNSKESAYNSAVSSYNLFPSQFSLNSVNWAYTAYSMAVNNHNSLVDLYNSTPATITQPVYLPYSFRQGNVRFGWSASVSVEVSGCEPINYSNESVASDFVRVGSKYSDRTESYRKEDFLDIDVSADAGLGHLAKVVAQVKESMNKPLGRLAKEPVADLGPEERATLGWIYHPWGIQPEIAESLGVPMWAKSAAQGLALQRLTTPPPQVPLKANPTRIEGPLTTEDASTVLAHLVCQTSSGNGAEIIATGTGTLIGEKGLVLTCAHVLVGPTLRLEFPAGKWGGTYDAVILFVNSEHDVALVHAKGLENDEWAVLRASEPSLQGESIVAIGNPGMDIGGTNLGGISSGIVSNPRLEKDKTIYLSADISIASGSSGGPLFSLKDGTLIGVVQLVATVPGFPQDGGRVASTGYLCLAAPANLLGEWLGLRNEP
jgi:S1-C subfamily serine protease